MKELGEAILAITLFLVLFVPFFLIPALRSWGVI